MKYSTSDWKLFKIRLAQWQENYMDKLTKEYVEILVDDKNASDKFWELERRIKKDKKHPGVIIELNKQNMIWDIAKLINEGVITTEDLDGFSSELIEQVKYILR